VASNPGINVRLRPVIVAYLDELAKIGGYGKGRSGVMRRFIENGIVRAIERRVVEKKDATDFGEVADDDADDED
jgi:hypothetical protein